MEPIELKVGTFTAPENWLTLVMKAYTDSVTEASDGKITFEYFYVDSLLSSAELAGGLEDGVVDLAMFIPVYTPAAFPIDQWAGGLTSGYDTSPIAGTLQGMASVAQWGFETDSYMAELDAAGVTPLIPRVLLHPQFGILCNDQINSLDEIKGKRARVGSATAGGEAEAVGSVPTTVAGAEVYSAFQQGVIDCTWTNVPDMQALGYAEIAKNYEYAGLNGWSHTALGISTTKWDALPEFAKDALWDSLPAFFEQLAIGNFEMNTQGVSIDGMKYSTPDKEMMSVIEKFHEELVSSLADTAPAGLSDPTASVELAGTLNSDWLTVVKELGYTDSEASWSDYVEANGDELPDLQAWVDAISEQILAGNRPK